MKQPLSGRRILLIAIVLAGVTTLLVDRYVSSAHAQAAVVPMTNEVVAVRDIPADTVLRANMLAVRAVPAQYLVPGAASDVGKVVGAVATSELYKGEPVLSARLFHGQSSGGLPYLIPADMRAYTISVTKLTGLSSMLQPGYHVDVIADLPTGRPAPDSNEATTVLQNIRVLAVGAVTGSVPRAASTPADRQTTVEYSTVTLLVTPTQAETLAYIAKSPVSLALRPATDHTIQPVSPVGLPQIVGGTR